MQKLIEKVQTKTEAFIEQRKNLVMVLSCVDNEAAMVMKIVNDIEQTSTSDVFFFFADDFNNQKSYVEGVIDKLYLQQELANQEAEKEKLDLLAEPPKDLKNNNFSPLQRLGKAMMYTRSLIPDIGAHNVIWVLYPQNVQNRESWHELIESFAPVNGIQDGMQGLRIIFRDNPDTLKFSPNMEGLPRIQFDDVDMGPSAIDDALEETIHDESIGDDQRFGAMLQKAMIDTAHGRLDQAYDAFKYMLGYYQHTKNYAVQSVIINSVGDIYRRKNQLDKAQHVFESAIEPSVKSGSATVLHNTALNIAENEFNRNNFEKAEEYYNQVDQLATKMIYADGKIYALNQEGECAVQLDCWDRAVEYWGQVVIFARKGEYLEDLEIALEKLVEAKDYLEADVYKAYQHQLHELKEGA